MLGRKNVLAAGVAAAIGIGFSGGAQAVPIFQGGSGGSIPGGEENEVLGEATASEPRGFGSNLSVDGKTKLRFTFAGKEAGFNNQFFIDGELIFENATAMVGDSVEIMFGSGSADGTADFAIPFRFKADEGDEGTVMNGENPDDSNDMAGVNFFVTNDDATTLSNEFTDNMSLTGTFLALDDFGSGDDDNHDDMVIRVQEIPTPSTLAFLATALIGLGVLGRRRRTV